MSEDPKRSAHDIQLQTAMSSLRESREAFRQLGRFVSNTHREVREALREDGLTLSQRLIRIGEALDRAGADALRASVSASAARALVNRVRGSRSRRGVVSAPGSRLIAILPYLFSRKTIEQTFTPGVSDMRLEYFDALEEKRVWLARIVYARWLFGIVETVVLSWGFSLLKKIRAIWKIVG